MTGHLSQNQIEEYGRQKLSAAELLSVSDHLSECETCRRLLERAGEADAAFFAMRSELFGDDAIALPPEQWVHPTVEEMAGLRGWDAGRRGDASRHRSFDPLRAVRSGSGRSARFQQAGRARARPRILSGDCSRFDPKPVASPGCFFASVLPEVSSAGCRRGGSFVGRERLGDLAGATERRRDTGDSRDDSVTHDSSSGSEYSRSFVRSPSRLRRTP